MSPSIYPRLPSILIIGAAITISIVVGMLSQMQAQGRFEQLEQEIVNSEDPNKWLAYADALYSQQRFQHAAQAYAHILGQNPYHGKAQFQYALALAQQQDHEALYQHMQQLSFEQAMMATELFARHELQACQSQQRFKELAHQARVQAVD